MKIRDVLTEFKSKPNQGESLEVLTLTEKNGFVRQSERFKKRLATEDTSNYKLIGIDDFAFNPYLLWAGAIARNDRFKNGVISPLYPTFSVVEGVSPGYLQHLLLSPLMISRYDSIAFGSIPRRRRSSVENFLNLSIPALPPLEEQRRIAGILDRSDSALSECQTKLVNLESLRNDAFGTWFPSDSNSTTIDSYLAHTQYGTAAKAGDKGAFPILRMGNLSNAGDIDLSDMKYIDLAERDVEKFTLKNGDILFNRTNSKEIVGKTAMYRGQESSMAYAGYLVRCRVNENAVPEFIVGYLNSRHGKAQLRLRAKAIVGMANINPTELKRMSIPRAPIEKQQRYARFYQKCEIAIAQVRRKEELLIELHRSLSTRAFQGLL